ncbi:hypothetical protein GMB70_13705 [Turicibacter sanguinis]|nr:hypothetical protein [Turicibacter sanguinis]
MTEEKLAFIESCLERKFYKYEIALLENFERASTENKKKFGFMVARGRSNLNVAMLLLAHELYEEYRFDNIKKSNKG